MKTRITLLCHGPTTSNRTSAFPADEPLEPAAREQTALLKCSLDRADRVLVSPLLRARQTADLLGLSGTCEPTLADCDYGRWSGKTMQTIAQEEPDALAAWVADLSAAPHAGEAMSNVVVRIAGWLDQAMDKGGHTVAITHASVIRACIMHILQTAPAAFWKIDVEPLSLTHLSSDGRRWSLRLPARSGSNGR